MTLLVLEHRPLGQRMVEGLCQALAQVLASTLSAQPEIFSNFSGAQNPLAQGILGPRGTWEYQVFLVAWLELRQIPSAFRSKQAPLKPVSN